MDIISLTDRLKTLGGNMPEEKTFTQEEIDKIVADRLTREQKKWDAKVKELERKHNESIEDYEERIKTANMTADEKYKLDLAKYQKQLEEKEGALKTIQVNSLKQSVLSKYKLPDKFINRVSGETEEDIEKSVKELQEAMGEYFKSQGAGTPTDLNGGSKDLKTVTYDDYLKMSSDERNKLTDEQLNKILSE